jgi:hypothetical protein
MSKSKSTAMTVYQMGMGKLCYRYRTGLRPGEVKMSLSEIGAKLYR